MKYEKEIREAIAQIFTTNVPINEVPINANLYTVGIDSMAYVRLIIKIENKFTIRIPEFEIAIEKSGSIDYLCKIVSKQIKLKNKVSKT